MRADHGHDHLHDGDREGEDEGEVSELHVGLKGTMNALYEAITMSPTDRKDRADRLFESVCEEDINQWLHRQMQDISDLF